MTQCSIALDKEIHSALGFQIDLFVFSKVLFSTDCGMTQVQTYESAAAHELLSCMPPGSAFARSFAGLDRL